MFFLLYFMALFPSIVQNCLLVVFLELLSVFPLDLEAFCCHRTLLPNPRVLARSSMFSSFSVCPLRDPRSTAFQRTFFRLLPRQLLHLLGISWPFQQLLREHRILFLMRLQSLWPKHFNSPCQPSSGRFVWRISPPRFLVRPFPQFPVLFPAMFPALFPARPWLLLAHFPLLQVR